jgi:ParB family chromosome partitioning protein
MQKNTQSKLGKGIGALLGNPVIEELKELSSDTATSKIIPEVNLAENHMVPVEQIHVSKYQPRKIFKEEEIKELSNSIKENGLIQPLIVKQADKGFELIAGERRLRASKMAGLTRVPVVVKRVTDKDTLVMAIIENVQRSDLNCVEEGLAYFQLMEEFKLTQEEVAKKIGKSRSVVANFLRILKLPREVVSLIQRDKLSFGHAKVLCSVKDDESCRRLANKVVDESISVRELEEIKDKKPRVAREGNTEALNPYAEKVDQFRDKLEKHTGYHFGLKMKKNGAGSIAIKFNNEAEFNDIFEYLLK